VIPDLESIENKITKCGTWIFESVEHLKRVIPGFDSDQNKKRQLLDLDGYLLSWMTTSAGSSSAWAQSLQSTVAEFWLNFFILLGTGNVSLTAHCFWKFPSWSFYVWFYDDFLDQASFKAIRTSVCMGLTFLSNLPWKIEVCIYSEDL